jgi:hypothetical protein
MNQDLPEKTPTSLLKRFWWAPLVGLPLVALLMFSLRDFVRDTLALPLSHLMWLVGIIVRSVPQVWFWTGLLIVALIIALRSLDRERRSTQTIPGKALYPARGRIAVWAERVNMLLKGKYSRHRFGYFVGKLILDVLAHEERLSYRDVERRLEQSDMDVPPAVRSYLLSRLRPSHTEARPKFFTRLKRFLGLEKQLTVQLNADLETIITFLENQLEV